MSGDLDRLKTDAGATFAATFGAHVCTCGPTSQRPERRIRGALVATVCLTCGGRVGKERVPATLERS